MGYILILVFALVGMVFIAFKTIDWIFAPLRSKAEERPVQDGDIGTLNIKITSAPIPEERTTLSEGCPAENIESLSDLINEAMVIPGFEAGDRGELVDKIANVFYGNDIGGDKDLLRSYLSREDVLTPAKEGFLIPYLTAEMNDKVSAGLFISPQGVRISEQDGAVVNVIAPIIVNENLPERDTVYFECEANLAALLSHRNWRSRILASKDVSDVMRTIKEYEREEGS